MLVAMGGEDCVRDAVTVVSDEGHTGDQGCPRSRAVGTVLRWSPTSRAEMLAAELRMLRCARGRAGRGVAVDRLRVRLDGGGSEGLVAAAWRARPAEPAEGVPPLVIVPGFLAGSGWFTLNLGPIAARSGAEVYVMDCVGAGLSSRPCRKFKTMRKEKVEDMLCDDLDAFVRAVGIKRFVLAGHSLGGFIAANYALRYPHRVVSLVGLSSAGLPESPPMLDQLLSTWKGKFAKTLWDNVRPGSVMRALGPWGPRMACKYSKRRLRRGQLTDEELEALAEYLFHTTAAPSCLDGVLSSVFRPLAWAHRPLARRFADLQVRADFIYGEADWMRWEHSAELLEKLPSALRGQVTVTEGAHHVMIDAADEVNARIAQILKEAAADEAARTPAAA